MTRIANELTASDAADSVPLVVVMGIYRSGSSCLAGILQHLGIYMGRDFIPPNPANPSGYFEDGKLSNLCRTFYREPMLNEMSSRLSRVSELSYWWSEHRLAACACGSLAGAKHPILCLLGSELLESVGPNIKFISINRTFEKSVASLLRQPWGWNEEAAILCQWKLAAARRDFLESHPHLSLEYESLCDDPAPQVERISTFLEISVASDRLQSIVSFVRTGDMH